MKLNYLLLLNVLFFIPFKSYTQPCPIGEVQFASQEEVDNFIINYPMCDQIDGNLKIVTTDVNNLNGLFNLSTIAGNLSIAGNPYLTNLSGLNNVNIISGDISIKNNQITADELVILYEKIK